MKKLLLLSVIFFSMLVHTSAQFVKLRMYENGTTDGNTLYYGAGISNHVKVPKGLDIYLLDYDKPVMIEKINDTVYEIKIRTYNYYPACDSLHLEISCQDKKMKQSYALGFFKLNVTGRLGFLLNNDKCTAAELETNIAKGISVFVMPDRLTDKETREYFTYRVTIYECIFFAGDKQVGSCMKDGKDNFLKEWKEAGQKNKIDKILVTSIRGTGPTGEIRAMPIEIFITG